MIYQKEASLQYVWQKGLFDQRFLKTSCGQSIEIVHAGMLNKNSGPDFKLAKIRIDDVLHVGHVEIHLKSSDWLRHGHQYDESYKNVILHVVIENDLVPTDHWLANLPCLELGDRLKIPEYKIARMASTYSPNGFHCYHQVIGKNQEFRNVLSDWKWDLVLERIERKSKDFYDLLKKCKGDFNAWLYQSFASIIAYPLNHYPMQQLTESLPFDVFKSYLKDSLSMEALFLGQAGLLSADLNDSYERDVHDLYTFMKHKYRLEPIPSKLWRYFRLRPFAFPDRRVALLAAFASGMPYPEDMFIKWSSVKEVNDFLDLKLSMDWIGRYRIGKQADKKLGVNLGDGLRLQLSINMIVPCMIAYGNYTGNKLLSKKGYSLLETMNCENNQHTRSFDLFDVEFLTALDSQAAVELKKNYCSKYRCLECQLGQRLLV